MNRRFFPVLLPGLLVMAGPVGAAERDAGRPTVGVNAPAPVDRLHPDRRQELLGRKIGAMILVGFPGQDATAEWPRHVAALIAGGRIGGVVLFAGNVASPEQVKALTGALRAAAGSLPPIIAIDQEGGRIQRLPRAKGFHGLPSARSIAATDPATACGLYLGAANELAEVGINTNFGPVVDLDANPGSPAIGRKARSYNKDPATVVTYARTFIAAHHHAGILTAAKHFPGHGSAIEDSHTGTVDITATWRREELEPFRALIADGAVDMVMVGHLIHPRFSDGDRPASLSRRAITEVLRGDLGYGGLVVTDDLGMGAIVDRFPIEDAAVMAVGAGADLLIVANRTEPDLTVADRIVAAVAGAVASGRIPMAAIDRSAGRIRLARARLADRHGVLASGSPICAEAAAATVPAPHAEAGTSPTLR